MFKILTYLFLIITLTVPFLAFISHAAPLANTNCPVGTTPHNVSFYCTDGKNIFGSFSDATIAKCQALSAKGSLACTSKINVNVNFNSKTYTVAVQRWSTSFFNRIVNSKYCPIDTTLTNSLCKSKVETFGNFAPNFISQCLADYDAQSCLTNRISNTKYDAVNAKLNTKPITPVVTPVVTPIITPVPPVIKPVAIPQTTTPKVVNGYNVTSLIKTPSSTVRPVTANSWNIIEGFDYSGNLKQIYDKNNLSFDDGTITMGAKKELTQNPVYSTTIDDERFYTKSAPYQGTKLIMKDKFQYGHISFVAKLPNSSGTMPAIWLFDEVKNQHYTEVDLFEIPGSEPGKLYTGTHYGQDFKTLKSDFSFKTVNTMSSEFHKYEVYKTPTKIVTLIDGQLIKEISVSNKTLPNGINGFNQPLNLIMNLNIGDKWAGAIDDTKLPTQMVIKEMVIENYSY
jgi:Glycosyl hydrolases family 16